MKIHIFCLKIGSLIFLLLCSQFFAGAQNFSIEGAVKDRENNPLAGNALLLDAGGGALLSGVFFENGAFRLTVDSTGSYVVRISALGFADADFSLQVTREKIKYELGDIVLKEQATQLGAVTVTARKKMFEKTADGTRFNVENTMLGKSANSAELLAKTPGVRVVGKKVNVFGRGEALLYLNGKEIPFETFSSLPPGEIKHLEIISNPSSQYDARAKAVVVITMKKSYHQGLQATLTEGFTAGFVPGARFGKHNMNNANLNMNLKKDRLSLTSYYANDFGTTWNENRFSTQTAATNKVFKTDYFYREDSKSKGVHYYRLGAGYEINDRSDVSFQYDGLRHYFELDVAQDGDYRAPDNKLTFIRMRNAATTTLNNHSGNMNYSLRLDSSGGLFFCGSSIQ